MNSSNNCLDFKLKLSYKTIFMLLCWYFNQYLISGRLPFSCAQTMKPISLPVNKALYYFFLFIIFWQWVNIELRRDLLNVQQYIYFLHNKNNQKYKKKVKGIYKRRFHMGFLAVYCMIYVLYSIFIFLNDPSTNDC